MKNAKSFAVSMIVTLAGLCFAPAVLAQEWPVPDRPIRILMPFPPGGTADTLSRLIANRLTIQLGLPVVVENKPGASTLIAVNELRRSAPDGHTILYTVTGTTSQLPHLYAKPPYDPFTDFTPLGLAAYNQLILTVTRNAPYNTLRELIDYARAHPGKVNYASFGNGSFTHIVSELLKKTEGIEMTHVPYKGGAPAAQAVFAGEVQILFDAPLTAINNARGGKVKLLAIAGPEHIAAIPKVPTMADAGLKGFDIPGLEQLLGPSGMSGELVAKVNAAIMKAVRSPEIAKVYREGGFVFVASTAEEHARIMRENYERWGEVIRRTGIRLD
ncbi:MAG: hypothetical protein A2V78_11630 [Betaproteobacteria bacterium RBG_16_64_18]|nr:MAG: hypothetical protein A2V78_11630 [Betaproteobacteria bacterium RBG_16_64_18]OGA08799.1 MAG: hypothetical protein A3H33_06290 [Betaproteobacteria bacterium RIFCSPLOWO2_02_FULL_65_20]OGA37276.1 MAG: hypothetical protein A3G26_10620 [Betaproteobacteria bacterium RIFCSPLOWO2_12_FULL_65_110]